MEFWEGAVLIVGGLWLVGRMSRASATHPLNAKPASISALGTVGPQGNTVATNTDGSTSLIAGEPLTPMAPPLSIAKQVNVNAPSTPVVRSPIVAHNNLAPRTFNL
jgi:hypothetical protein